MDTTYLNTASESEQAFTSTNLDFTIKQEDSNYASLLAWSEYVNSTANQSPQKQPVQQQNNFMDVLGSAELDMSSLVDQSIWIMDSQQQQEQINSSFDKLFTPWASGVEVPSTIREEWSVNSNSLSTQQQSQQIFNFMPIQTEPQSFMLPPSPPQRSPTKNTFMTNNSNNNNKEMNLSQDGVSTYLNTYQRQQQQPQQQKQQQKSREATPPSSISTSTYTSASGSNSPTSTVSTPPTSSLSYYLPQQIPQLYQQMPTTTSSNTTNTETYTPKAQRGPGRRKSSDGHSAPRTYRRRASSHPSVASVVSLSAHEPISRIIDGIEHITFLYSHDRLVKEYTLRTDVSSVCLEDISVSFRVQNAIYPRANVSRDDYDGNRWEYETSCNKLGWELCWLNQEQLCGRRGLIQRAVDSYRNRHAEMRSRRVTRQEKVANGTLRKRRAKKAFSAIL
jgi:hypothetical protein